MESKLKKLYKAIAIVNVLVFLYSSVSLAVSILAKSDTWLSIGYSIFCLVSLIGVIRNSIRQEELKISAIKKKDEEVK